MAQLFLFYLPLLSVLIPFYFSWCMTGTDALKHGGLRLTCTSPCQQSQGDVPRISTTALPPCDITPSCNDRTTVLRDQAPGGPLLVNMAASAVIGPDGKVYLEMTHQWKASQDRIGLLTGFVISVFCSSTACASQFFCVTISFKRTLTIEDASSNFSVSCQNGNFSQPGENYNTIIRSIPMSKDDSNRESISTTLPSCQQEPAVSLCNINTPEDWIPVYSPEIKQISNGSVVVSFWPSSVQEYPGYNIYLQEIGVKERRVGHEFVTFFDSQRDGKPFVYFDNVPPGVYIAMISIDDNVCFDCTLFESDNNLTVFAMPTPAPSSPPTTPRDPEEVKSTPEKARSPIPMAALAGALGGVLGVILIIFLISRMRKRKSAPTSQFSGDEKELGGEDKSTMLHHRNNLPYDDFDSMTETGIISQWPPDDGHGSHLFGIVNPSMIPPIIHNEWKHTNGRLAQESEFYANTIGYQRGDSISKVAVDVHSAMDHQTVFKNSLDPQMEQPDSGVDSIYSEGNLEDGQTMFSLALTNLGEEV
nr:uncharacterized protein LOC129256565 [Lytechinus pictus]